MKNEILVKYLKAGITPFHLVQQCAADLETAGFAPLAMEEAWHLEESKKYYINHHGTTILAFTVPKKDEMLASQDNTHSALLRHIRIILVCGSRPARMSRPRNIIN